MCKSRCCNRCYGAERHHLAGQRQRKEGLMKEANVARGALRVKRMKPGYVRSLRVTHGAPVAIPCIGISSTLKLSPRAAFYHGHSAALAESAPPNTTFATI